METAPLKSFATWARTALIREVGARITAVLAPASKERVESASAITALERDIASEGGGETGRDAVADKAAYTWFNRIIALRFMDANGYTGIGIVSPPRGQTTGQPEVLADAKRGNIDPAVVTNKRTIEAITALLDGTRRSDDAQGEAYASLFAEYCRHWNRSMPFMFEREGDYTELLIPANLLADESILARAQTVLTEEVCQDVEVIGWLYQFYISERKQEVFNGFKAKGSARRLAGAAEIPAATQLFTPHWIVRYLVENSLGRLWMLNHPRSRLTERMDYYVKPDDSETEFLRVSSPEELTVIDPACGSGHMLTYAFDLLFAIYEEAGYSPADIPGSILTHNLFGTEIDARAGSLAAFALTMKARARQRTFFNKSVKPNICVIKPASFNVDELDLLSTRRGSPAPEEVFWNQFSEADTAGSLIRPQADLAAVLARHLRSIDDDGSLLNADMFNRANRVLNQAHILANRYAVLIANPPYMGGGNMGAVLSSFLRQEYFAFRQDLYTCFVKRGIEMVLDGGALAAVTGDTWMFIKSFEEFRDELLSKTSFSSLIHIHDSGNLPSKFGANAAYVLTIGSRPINPAVFIRTSLPGVDPKRQQVEEALRHRTKSQNWFVSSPAKFRQIPGSPIAYAASADVLKAFGGFPGLREQATPLQGLATADDGRFLRRWWEVSGDRFKNNAISRDDGANSGLRWFPFTKGGDFRRWYGNNEYVVNWQNDGQELHAFKPRAVIRNAKAYFREALSWTLISSSNSSFRYVPPGSVFGHKGPAILVDDPNDLLAVAAYLNSTSASRFLEFLSPTVGFEVGHIAMLPLPMLDGVDREATTELIEIARQDWNGSELSWEFEHFAGIAKQGGATLAETAHQVFENGREAAQRTQELEAANNLAASEVLSLAVSTDGPPLDGIALTKNPYYQRPRDSTVEELQALSATRWVLDLVSYAVGCMFGRYSLDEAGLILSNQGDTRTEYLTKVPNPSFIPDSDNVIPVVDGDWFEDDIVARFRQFLRAAFGEENFEENLRFITETLGVKDLRDYFVKSFYKDHVQRYKRRPIYWLFSSPKGSFSALIYMHRYTPSTVSTVLNEYLREFKSKLEASRQHHVRLAASDGTPREKAAAEKEVDRVRKVLLELDEYEHDVLYPLATQQLAIDLDDGIFVNYQKFGIALKDIGLKKGGADE